MKFNLKALIFSGGIIWGISVFFLCWWLIILEGTDAEAMILTRMYPGFSLTPLGSLIGLLWGIVDGMIGCAIFGWLYNKLVDRFR